jgi:hypothetical protein
VQLELVPEQQQLVLLVQELLALGLEQPLQEEA